MNTNPFFRLETTTAILASLIGCGVAQAQSMRGNSLEQTQASSKESAVKPIVAPIWMKDRSGCSATPGEEFMIGSITIREEASRPIGTYHPGQTSIGKFLITVVAKGRTLLSAEDTFKYYSEPGHGTWKLNYAVTGTANDYLPASTNVSFDGSDASNSVKVTGSDGKAYEFCTVNLRLLR